MKRNKAKKDFSRIDYITKNFLIVSCVVLGSIFLAACAYLLTLIGDAQNEKQYVNSNNSRTNKNRKNDYDGNIN